MGIKTILIVDDNQSVREALEILLVEKYNVFTADNGYEALALVRKVFFDLVLLDVCMPGLNGLQVLEEIKKINPLLPVVMLSGGIDGAMVEKAMELGASDFLFKPADNNKIQLSIKQAIEGY